MGPILRYNVQRLGLFAAFLGIGYLLGLAGVALLAAALLASGLTSYFLLARQRAAMIEAVSTRVTQRRERSARKVAREDEYADRLLAAEETEPPPAG